jgi:murein DD-endopeptidase MepM/ murein hydrolase activator NlpD
MILHGKFVCLFLCIGIGTAAAQQSHPEILDTVETESARIIIFKNHTWSYLKEFSAETTIARQAAGMFDSTWVSNQIAVYGKQKIPFDTSSKYEINLLENESEFAMPAVGKVRRGRSYSHDGIDLSMERGDTVHAAFDGRVRYAMYNTGGYGNLLIVRHLNGLETYYAHLSEFCALVNQEVKAGDCIGLVGSTGRSTSPHLHFELRFMDVPLDPEAVIDFTENTLKSDRLTINAKDIGKSHASSRKLYKIRKGDSLASVARKYHTTVIRLAKLNRLKVNARLRVGRRIIVG